MGYGPVRGELAATWLPVAGEPGWAQALSQFFLSAFVQDNSPFLPCLLRPPYRLCRHKGRDWLIAPSCLRARILGHLIPAPRRVPHPWVPQVCNGGRADKHTLLYLVGSCWEQEENSPGRVSVLGGERRCDRCEKPPGVQALPLGSSQSARDSVAPDLVEP